MVSGPPDPAARSVAVQQAASTLVEGRFTTSLPGTSGPDGHLFSSGCLLAFPLKTRGGSKSQKSNAKTRWGEPAGQFASSHLAVTQLVEAPGTEIFAAQI
jgi:hypothetical protein